mmetsp:Transcript_21479/g.46553  ORF Transcript_21479/g.46553 Transcript_21479/m.46553 type:complete len:200 (-) Transcript_21479:852-1451(-)
MDQTMLLVKVLPSRDARSGRYEKVLPNVQQMQPDDRVTMYVCTNENGSQKLPLTLVGRLKQPWKFPDPAGHQTLPYIFAEDGRSSSKTLQEWWNTTFLPHIRKQSSSTPVLLVTSMSECCELVDEKGQVRVEVLPRNSSTTHQPVAQGLGQTLKTSYRYRLLHAIFSTFADRVIRRTVRFELYCCMAELLHLKEFLCDL